MLETTDGPVEQLEGLVDALLTLHQERPTALMIISQEFFDRTGRITTAHVLPLARVVTDTVAVIEAGQDAGVLRDGDPLALTAALHGALLHGALGQSVYAATANRTPDGDWNHHIAKSALANLVTVR